MYSLAVTFYHLLSGRSPYDTETMSAFQIQVKIVGEPLDLSILTKPWDSFLLPFLNKLPTQRADLMRFPAGKNQAQVLSADTTFLNGPEPEKVVKATAPIEPIHSNYDQKVSLKSYVEKIHDIEFEMVLVRGGKFMMGSDERPDEQPVHEQYTEDFFMAATPVTQELWMTIMDSNPSGFKGDKHPVENVSWEDAQNFIMELNMLTKREYRLPTEVEWEYAAGGGAHKRTIWSGSNSKYDLTDYCWFDQISHGATKAAGSLKPNALGLYDMSGNVCEWCEDDYYATDMAYTFYNSPSPYKVLKGGCWFYKSFHCRVSSRFYEIPLLRSKYNGFRLAHCKEKLDEDQTQFNG